ncbi:hypothetical protein BF23_21710 [Klebsiella variicola]|nr:hypothetical protein BF23_21710 [Klebsiella variicola]
MEVFPACGVNALAGLQNPKQHDLVARTGAQHRLRVFYQPNIGSSRYSLITSALTMSIKNAPTIGTTRKAICDGPKRSVIACILAIAVGVAPRPNPQWPAASTAAS